MSLFNAKRREEELEEYFINPDLFDDNDNYHDDPDADEDDIEDQRYDREYIENGVLYCCPLCGKNSMTLNDGMLICDECRYGTPEIDYYLWDIGKVTMEW